MKATFPHLGNAYIAVKALFDGLGIEYIIPPQNLRVFYVIWAQESRILAIYYINKAPSLFQWAKSQSFFLIYVQTTLISPTFFAKKSQKNQ